MALKDIDLKYQGGRIQTGRSLNISAVSGAPSAASLPLGNTTKAASTGINLIGSFAGGEDDSNGTDSTPRINTYSYQRASTNSFGEVMRNWLMRWDSKAMLAWYGPQATGTQSAGYDGNGDALTTGVTWKPWAWLGAHYEANDHASVHGHISIEVPDTTGALQTRLEILFADRATGLIGVDKSFIITNQSDFVVRCSNGQVLRMAASAGTEKAIEFNNDSFGATASRRWKVRATSTAESGSNVGTDFQVARYDDTGTVIDSPLHIDRATGQVQLGGQASGTAGGLLVTRNAGVAIQVNPLATGGQAVLVTGTDATAAAYQGNVTGDTVNRYRVFTDGKTEWGSGSATRDTNLYRSGAATLATDSNFTVGQVFRAGIVQGSTSSGGTLTLRSTSNATKGKILIGTSAYDDVNNWLGVGTASPTVPLEVSGAAKVGTFTASTNGVAAAGTFNTTADGTASLGTVVINPFSTAKRALDIRLSADTVSRLRVDMSAGTGSGTLTFGNGTLADTNLYRSGTSILKTDGKLITATGLGVGNAASATVAVGVLANKMEVFDASGASLGFVPIYATIT